MWYGSLDETCGIFLLEEAIQMLFRYTHTSSASQGEGKESFCVEIGGRKENGGSL